MSAALAETEPRFDYPIGTLLALASHSQQGTSYPEGPVIASTPTSVTIVHRSYLGDRKVTATRDTWEDGRVYVLGVIDPVTGLVPIND